MPGSQFATLAKREDGAGVAGHRDQVNPNPVAVHEGGGRWQGCCPMQRIPGGLGAGEHAVFFDVALEARALGEVADNTCHGDDAGRYLE